MSIFNEMPDLLRNRYDVKSALIHSIDGAIQILKENKIEGVTFPTDANTIFVTNFGLVIGTIVDLSNEEDNDITKPIKAIVKMALNQRNRVIKDMENARLINDTSFFLLSDVTIMPFTAPEQKTRIGEMVLFADQVVGVTAGQQSLG